MSVLENIHNHQDLIKLTPAERTVLCSEIRDFLVSHVAKTGGHLASNLGVVELTVAIETVYDTAKDRLVFDVGHQSYIHKLLTGRQADFDALRQFGGMAGFPKPSESISDSFVAGHASSSVSIALGMARARHYNHEDYQVIALMGDGAATGGMAFEGLNDAAVSHEPMVIILNDNQLSIDQNVGGVAFHLRSLRIKQHYLGMKKNIRSFLDRIPGGRAVHKGIDWCKGKLRSILIPTTIFESMGFYYLGPVDGHDTEQLISLLKRAKALRQPVLIHAMTQKGKGYAPAEEHPKLFHGIGKFDPDTGTPVKKAGGQSFSDAFGQAMMLMAPKIPELCAITAAMPGGTGLLEFKTTYPDRLYDVGIAEEHAMSMTGGLAKQGAVPVIALYSTFLQRAYDMILQDICMLNQHAVICVDRAGLVGEDGETHHGVFDVGFLREAPGLRLLAPGSCLELQEMLYWAVAEQKGPVAIRYPRGSDREYSGSAWEAEGDKIRTVSSHRNGNDLTLITYGVFLQNIMDAAQLLSEHGLHAKVLRIMQLNPLQSEDLLKEIDPTKPVFVVEEVSANCGVKEKIAWEIHKKHPQCFIDGLDLGEKYVTHGSLEELYDAYGLSPQKICQYVMEALHHEN